MMRLLFLVCLSVLFAGSVAQASPLLAAVEPPFRTVVVDRETVAPGQEQALSVTLDHPGGALTILKLAVSYPGGATQEVLDETVGSGATVSWLVPPDAGDGRATFKLTTSGCGCGDRSQPASSTNLEGTAQGSFLVRP